MLPYVDIVTISALNSSGSQQTACSHSIDFESCLCSPLVVTQILGRRAQHCSSKLTMEVCTGVEKCNNSHHYTDYSSFQIKSATHHPALSCFSLNSMPCTANALPSGSCGTGLIPWCINSIQQKSRKLPWQEAKPLVGLERQTGSLCKLMSATAKEGVRGMWLFHFSQLWPAQLPPASLTLKSKEPILPLKISVLTRKTWEELGKTIFVGNSFSCYHTTIQWQSCLPRTLRHQCLNKAINITIKFIWIFFLRIFFFCPQSAFLFKTASSWSAGVWSKHVDCIINHTQKPGRG